MVAVVEPAWLGSVSIHKGVCGVKELHVMFVGRWPYAFIVLFIVGVARVHWGVPLWFS